jgi:hypothetical protein
MPVCHSIKRKQLSHVSGVKKMQGAARAAF